MPLLDHFHPPLHGPRRWEGFLSAWASIIAKQVNCGNLPADYFAEPDISLATNRDRFEVLVFQDIGSAELHGAVELISPANKDSEGNRQRFVSRCAEYLKLGVGVVLIDIVTARIANLHADLVEMLFGTSSAGWEAPTNLYAVAYQPRLGPLGLGLGLASWPKSLALGQLLPELPLYLTRDLCATIRFEETYLETCQSLRISG